MRQRRVSRLQSVLGQVFEVFMVVNRSVDFGHLFTRVLYSSGLAVMTSCQFGRWSKLKMMDLLDLMSIPSLQHTTLQKRLVACDLVLGQKS